MEDKTMRKMYILFAPMLFLNNAKAMDIGIENKSWKIKMVKQEVTQGNCDNCTSLVFHFECFDVKINKSFQFQLKNKTGQIREGMLNLYDDKLIIVGDFSSVHNIVTVYDLTKRQIVDEIYTMSTLFSENKRFMSYLNLSSRNTPKESLYDIFILYDFSQTPEWNRIESNKPVNLNDNRLALSKFESDVGIPIFPEINIQKQTLSSLYYDYDKRKFVYYGDNYSQSFAFWSSNNRMIVYLTCLNYYIDKNNRYLILADVTKGIKEANVYIHLLKKDEIFVKGYTPNGNEEIKIYPEEINIDEETGNVKIKLNLDTANQNREINVNPIINCDQKYNIAEVMSRKYKTKIISNEKMSLAKAQLKRKEYDFGKIKEGEVAKFEIILLNTGNEDLIVKGVNVPCNCTKVTVRDSNIKPNTEGTIECEFNSKGKIDKQEYGLNIYTNDPNNSSLEFMLKGDVIK